MLQCSMHTLKSVESMKSCHTIDTRTTGVVKTVGIKMLGL